MENLSYTLFYSSFVILPKPIAGFMWDTTSLSMPMQLFKKIHSKSASEKPEFNSTNEYGKGRKLFPRNWLKPNHHFLQTHDYSKASCMIY